MPGTKGSIAARRKKAQPEKSAEAVADRDLPPVAGELYNLADDIGETNNVAAAQPALVAEMAAKIEQIRAGRQQCH